MPSPQASSGLWTTLFVHCNSCVVVVEAVCVRVLVAVLSVAITFLKEFSNNCDLICSGIFGTYVRMFMSK